MRVLFILKRGGTYGYPSPVPSSGLFNSIQFVVAMLNGRLHQHAKMVVVPDNNRIDHEVAKFRPDLVIIEALWMVPEKFAVLRKLHPHVRWIVRVHSAMPFLANEGNAIDWLLRYAHQPHVTVAANDLRTAEELRLLTTKTVLYLPNFYPVVEKEHRQDADATKNANALNISCFGSIRPLKNHLIQAVAAIAFAEELKRPLHFHINGTRLEGGGEPILKNVRALFRDNNQHSLVEHPWLPHYHFVQLVRRMDAGLQVSFSETFNIIAADHVANGIPIVTSAQVPWMAPKFAADPTDSADIVRKLRLASKSSQRKNLRGLREFSEHSVMFWKALTSGARNECPKIF